MTCKDCLHYESHKHFFSSPDYEEDFDDYFKDVDVECKCPEFTARSEWVHLPCKVGNKLYEVTSRKTISEYRVTAIRIELFSIFIDWEITQGFVDRYISDMPAGEIGKTVFLTREEAEKALEVQL